MQESSGADVTVTDVDNAPAAPTVTGVSDNDSTATGVTGEDFTVSWTVSSSSDVSTQEIYILPSGTTLDTSSQTAVATFNDNTTASWTGTSSETTDSTGTALSAQAYDVYVVTADSAGQESSDSSAHTPTAE